MRFFYVLFFLFWQLLFTACNPAPAPASASLSVTNRPNVLLIVADDLGWADLNCYGNPLVRSPHLDELARAGVQFMQAYAAAPLGYPSRLALQTGLYPARIGKRGLDETTETIAQLARRAGFTTAHVGKWGMGQGAAAPEKQGYDHVFAAAADYPDSYYHPFFTTTPLPDLLAESQPGDYLTDKLTDHALDWLAAQNSSWLLSLSFYAPHAPLEGRKDQVAAYQQLIDTTHWRKFPNPVYAAMVSVIDENVGRLVSFLRETGQLDNTLIIFTSDNGGLDQAISGKLGRHTPPTDNGILRGGKGSLYEGGIRVPFLLHFPAYATTTYATLEPVIGTDVFPTVGAALSMGEYAASPDGRSLLPLLRGEQLKERTLFWRFAGAGDYPAARAARRGDFKVYYDEASDSSTYFNLGALPDESLKMAVPPEGGRLFEALMEWGR